MKSSTLLFWFLIDGYSTFIARVGAFQSPSSVLGVHQALRRANHGGVPTSGNLVHLRSSVTEDDFLEDFNLFADDTEARLDLMDESESEGFPIELFIPLTSAAAAFLTYDLVADAFNDIIELITNKNWVSVDGGAYKAKIIAPAINGLVVPAISLLYATLTSTTISTLRQRQMDIRKSINTEAVEMTAMLYLVDSFPDASVQAKCRQYLAKYTDRIIGESEPGSELHVKDQRGMESELFGLQRGLYSNTAREKIPGDLLDRCNTILGRLHSARHDRITSLQSTYPRLHFFVLGSLSIGECIGFLMQTNQDVLVFLNSVQLKLLWSMLIATFTACFTVINDLRQPFSGGYQVATSVNQLRIIRSALRDKEEDDEMKAKQQE